MHLIGVLNHLVNSQKEHISGSSIILGPFVSNHLHDYQALGINMTQCLIILDNAISLSPTYYLSIVGIIIILHFKKQVIVY